MAVEKNTNTSPEKREIISLSDFFGGSYFVTPRGLVEARKKLRKASSFIIQDYIFGYFSSESGRKIGYKHFFTQQLSKDLGLDRKTFREGLKEIEEAGILRIYDFEHKGKIAFFPNVFNRDLLKKLDAKELFINIDLKFNISISDTNSIQNIITFPVKNMSKLEPQSGETLPIKCIDSTHQVGKLEPQGGETLPTLSTARLIDWSTFGADLEKLQESYIKEDLYKESFIQENKFTDKANEKKITSKENDLNEVVYKNSNLVKEDSSKNDKQENSDLTKQKVIEQMAKRFIENIQKESSEPSPAPAKVVVDVQKSKDVLELEDALHSLGVKEKVYDKALTGHGYEKVKNIYDDMYKCLNFQKNNNLESISNKGLYLSQRLEKLDNPEIKLSFICHAYEESKVSSQEVFINDNEPKIYQNKDLVNKILDTMYCEGFHRQLGMFQSKVEYIVSRMIEKYENTLKDTNTEKDYEIAKKFGTTLISFEEKVASINKFFKEFKTKFKSNDLDLFKDLIERLEYNSISQSRRKNFLNWFEGI